MEPHETFTWYDIKPYIHKVGDGYMMEDVNVYATKRNRLIRLKRNILGFIFMLSGIGLVFIAAAFH